MIENKQLDISKDVDILLLKTMLSELLLQRFPLRENRLKFKQYSQVIAVSYTHLTLPTNREV